VEVGALETNVEARGMRDSRAWNEGRRKGGEWCWLKKFKKKNPKLEVRIFLRYFQIFSNIFVNIPLVFVFRVNYTNTPKVWKN